MLGMKRFRMAPMRGLILWITVLVLPLPLLIGWAGSAAGTGLLWIVSVFIGAIYLFVWFYMRPTAFELGTDSLDIVWPLRRESTSLSSVNAVESLSGSEFRQKYGPAIESGQAACGAASVSV